MIDDEYHSARASGCVAARPPLAGVSCRAYRGAQTGERPCLWARSRLRCGVPQAARQRTRRLGGRAPGPRRAACLGAWPDGFEQAGRERREGGALAAERSRFANRPLHQRPRRPARACRRVALNETAAGNGARRDRGWTCSRSRSTPRGVRTRSTRRGCAPCSHQATTAPRAHRAHWPCDVSEVDQRDDDGDARGGCERRRPMSLALSPRQGPAGASSDIVTALKPKVSPANRPKLSRVRSRPSSLRPTKRPTPVLDPHPALAPHQKHALLQALSKPERGLEP